MKAHLNLALVVVIILAFVYSIYQKEEIIENGDVVYLALAPVDPRSIMQGDYMRLRYEVETGNSSSTDYPKSGYLIMKADERKVAPRTGDLLEDAQPKGDEFMFKFTSDGYRINIQPDSFLFQQGLRKLYAQAKYGIFRVDGKEHLLVGLADGDLKEIKPPTAE